MFQNVMDVYNQASHQDIIDGMNWYSEAKHQCSLLARRNAILLQTAIGVVAALSPRVNWGRNVIAAENLVRGLQAEGFGANKDKARRILNGEAPLDVLRGNKVISFYHNIIRPKAPHHVTVDRWALRVAYGPDRWSDKVNTPTDRQYLEVGNAYREAAAIVGILPLQIQAITWVSIKRRSGAW
jgi:hypothetical protein